MRRAFSPLRFLDRLVEVIATAAFVVMLLAALLQVLVRYVLLIPVPWTEALARVLFTLSMMLGIALAIRRGEHIRVEALGDRLGPRARLLRDLVFQLLLLVLLAVLARGTLRMLAVTWETYLIALGWLRAGHLFLAQLVAIGLMALYVLVHLVESARRLAAGDAGSAAR